MKIIVFDTETTGLIPKNISLYSKKDKKPYIVQLSWLVFDTVKNKLDGTYDYIIKLPKGVKIPKEASDIHKITNKIMNEKGVDIGIALSKFYNDLIQCNMLIAHNITFDKKMLMIEFYRNGYGKHFIKNKYNEYCTMIMGTPICNITMISKWNGKPFVRYCKLVELHDKLFNETPNNLHNSLIDILVCFRCYYKMYNNIDILTIDKNLNNIYNNFK
tara:strand:- start:960 stop:1607 length:648 start_codon:yes stop_codon:yes gene_type:complete